MADLALGLSCTQLRISRRLTAALLSSLPLPLKNSDEPTRLLLSSSSPTHLIKGQGAATPLAVSLSVERPSRRAVLSDLRVTSRQAVTLSADSCLTTGRDSETSRMFRPSSFTPSPSSTPASSSSSSSAPSTPQAQTTSSPSPSSQADDPGRLPLPARVFVAGATGQTGQRVVRSLVKRGVSVQAGVRNSEKASQLFADLPKDKLDLVKFDVLDDLSSLSAVVDPRAEAIIVATGFSSPQGGLPNPFLPWQVDCTGTTKIVDAARSLGINRLVLVTSILTNAPAWGQALNPAYLVLNLFGLVLVAKLQAERYIQRSGINYTIVRPGGLRNSPPKGNIVMSKEDTLASGSISRDSVAEVAVEALLTRDAWFKIVEIVEQEDAPKQTFQELFAGVK